MRLVSLTTENFRALRGTRHLDLQDGITAVVGSNEKGKTSTVLAIAYALYGPDGLPKGVSGSEVTTHGTKSSKVRLVFELNGDTYEIQRSPTDATLTRQGQERPEAKGRDAVTQRVTRLLGIDRVGFLISTFSRQDELDALAGKQGAERVSTILRLLGIESVSDGIKTVREAAREQRRRLELLRAQMQGDPAEVRRDLAAQRADLEKVQDEVATVGQLIATSRADLEEKDRLLSALAPAVQAYQEYQQARGILDARVDDARNVVTRLSEGQPMSIVSKPEPPVLSDVPDLDESAVATQSEKVQSLRERFYASDRRVDELKRQIASLTDQCPTCLRPFSDDEDAAKHRAGLEAALDAERQRRAELRKEGAEERLRLEGMVNDRNVADALRRKNEAAQQVYERQLRDYEHSQQWEAAAEERRREAQEALDAAERERDALEPADDPSRQLLELQEAVRIAQESVREQEDHGGALRVREAVLQSSVTRLEAQLAAMAEREQEILACQRELVATETAASELTKLKEGLIARVIPTLQERGSALVSDLTDGQHSELALSPDYEILWRGQDGQLHPFAGLSGGAQRVFALALRLAIAEMRAGTIGFLVLDECFESLDEDRVDFAWSALQRLTNKYQQILVVTHVGALRDRAPNVVAL